MTVTTTAETTTTATNGTFVMQKWEENANHNHHQSNREQKKKHTENKHTKCEEKTKTQNEVLIECTPGEAREPKWGSQARIGEEGKRRTVTSKESYG